MFRLGEGKQVFLTIKLSGQKGPLFCSPGTVRIGVIFLREREGDKNSVLSGAFSVMECKQCTTTACVHMTSHLQGLLSVPTAL